MSSIPNGVNIAENFNRLSRVHERYRQMTYRWTTTYSERERVHVR